MMFVLLYLYKWSHTQQNCIILQKTELTLFKLLLCQVMLWTVHLNEAPNKGCHRAAVAVGNKLYSFEGEDVYIFNTVSLCWRKLPPVTAERGEHLHDFPSPGWGHTAVPIEDVIYIWGGYKKYYKKYCNVLHAFDVDTHKWFKPGISGTVPAARYGHSSCVLEKVMYIHGGLTQNGLTNDIYKLDTTTTVWSLINTRGTLPPASYGHSATIIGTKMFVFGGWEVQWLSSVNNNIRVFDTETNCWLSTPSAQFLSAGSYNHSAFAYKGELYIFGGCKNQFHSFNDMWKLNPQTFSWKKIEPKGKGPWSGMYNMCCYMVGDLNIQIGGSGDSKDLYILDLNPSLKTLCKLAVIQNSLEQWELPHNLRWELAAMTTNSKIQ